MVFTLGSGLPQPFPGDGPGAGRWKPAERPVERFYPKAIAWRPHSRHKSSVSGGRQSTLLVFGLHPAPTGFGPISVRASTPSRHIASIQIQVQASRKGSLLPRLTNFTQADITRALRGATKAGMVVEKLTIGPHGGTTPVGGPVWGRGARCGCRVAGGSSGGFPSPSISHEKGARVRESPRERRRCKGIWKGS